MQIYFVLIIVILVFGYGFRVNDNKPYKKIYLICICLFVILLGGLRAVSVGTDTRQYWSAFNLIKELPADQLWDTRYEPGFVILCRLLSGISDNPHILLMVSSIMIFVPCFIFIYRNSADVVLSSYLFVTLGFILSMFNLMRQGLAIGIILIGVEFFFKRKNYFFFLLMCVLAMQFHQSAIISVVLIFVPSIKKWDLKKIFIATCLAPIVFVLAFAFFRVFGSLLGYMDYLGSEYSDSNYFASAVKVLMNLFYLGTVIFAGGYLRHSEDQSIGSKVSFIDREGLFTDIFLISILFLQLYFYICGMSAVIMERVTVYYNLFIVVALPRSVINSRTLKDKFAFSYFIIFASLLYFIIIGIFRPYWTDSIPYTFGGW